jgi:hypothetical protein
VKLRYSLAPIAALCLTVGCKQNNQPLTAGEAQQALEEVSVSAEATNVTAGSIDIATNFTIGGAVEKAAEEIKSYLETTLPCAEITLIDATLTVEYGAKPGDCTYKGLTYSGTHIISVDRNDENDVLVHHEWAELTNGKVSVTGTADVTWSLNDATRRVEHEVEWTRLSDGRTGVGSGDRLQKALEGGIGEGFQEDGSLAWDGKAGRWDLAIEGVQIRWSDPVPQAGVYRLATPQGKNATMSFERIDDDTIKVTVASGEQSFDFNVSKLGVE